MIAPLKPVRPRKTRISLAHQRQFLGMIPRIRAHARIVFRGLPREAREEMTQEVLANCWQSFCGLAARRRADKAYPSPLAVFAARQARSGRRVGSKLNIRDISSPYAQLMKGIRLERLDRFDTDTEEWMEVIVEDRRATPAHVAQVRIDFADWLHRLSRRRRRIAEVLATGESTGAAARRFHVSASRISQLRCELANSWREFLGEQPCCQQRAKAA
jgi:hypothetical protein